MPIFINPPPQRIRVTREDFVIPEGALVRIDPAPEVEIADIREMLKALLPGAQISRKLDGEVTVELSLGAADATVEGLPEGAAAQGYSLEVSPDGIRLRAATVAGWRYGVLTLAQLAGETAVVGARVQDWPAFAERGVHKPRSAAHFKPK
jgi:hexosaminidase